jgi:hypothetical protein
VCGRRRRLLLKTHHVKKGFLQSPGVHQATAQLVKSTECQSMRPTSALCRRPRSRRRRRPGATARTPGGGGWGVAAVDGWCQKNPNHDGTLLSSDTRASTAPGSASISAHLRQQRRQQAVQQRHHQRRRQRREHQAVAIHWVLVVVTKRVVGWVDWVDCVDGLHGCFDYGKQPALLRDQAAQPAQHQQRPVS